MALPPLHPALEPVAFLLGEWEGPGAGSYPTIEDFSYIEHLAFGHTGKPFLTYGQRTWSPTDRSPMHAEAGYLRVTGPVEGGESGEVGVELVVAQPTGMAEVHVGSVVHHRVRLRSTDVVRTPTAKEVAEVERELSLGDDGVLEVRLAMAAVGVPLTHHLLSSLSPVGG